MQRYVINIVIIKIIQVRPLPHIGCMLYVLCCMRKYAEKFMRGAYVSHWGITSIPR